MLILLIFLQLVPSSEGTWGTCCGTLSYAPYANAMTPSGFPIYGMAPYASSSVAYSGFPSVYSYGTGGYPVDGSGVSFDPVPSGQVPPGSVVGQPVAIKYFNQPIPVDIDPAALRPLGPTTFMRVPIYGIARNPSSSSYRIKEVAPEVRISKYSKFKSAHSTDFDISRGYQPAYSNWNKQPIQAVFRQPSSTSVASGSSTSETSVYNPGSGVPTSGFALSGPMSSR